MSKRGLFLVIALILSAGLAMAAEDSCLYYFYGEECVHCGVAGTYLEDLQRQYPELQIHKFEVYHNKANLHYLQQYFEAYEVPVGKQGVPVIFFLKNYFVGDKPIIDYLEGAVLSNKDASCPVLVKDETLGIIGEKSPHLLIKTLTFLIVTKTAIADSFNPCAIAVLLILLGILLSTADIKRRLLWIGAAFILSVYTSYFLFGVGILTALKSAGIGYYFYKSIGALAIIIGLLNIRRYSGHGKFLLAKIPFQWKPWLKKMLNRTASPAGSFIVGFTVSLFTLPCAGRTYQMIHGLLAEKTTQWAALPILLYYLLIFVLPLIIITMIIYFSAKRIRHHQEHIVDATGEIERRRQKSIKLLYLVGGSIMLILGVLVLFFF